MKVPRSIKDHYHHPLSPPAPAAMEDLLHYNIALPHTMRIKARMLQDAKESSSKSTCSKEEQNLWLKSLVSLQSDILLKIEKEKMKNLVEMTHNSTTSKIPSMKCTPKSLKELAKYACTAEQYRLLQADSTLKELPGDVASEKVAYRNRIASNDDVRSTSLQRFRSQTKRRNSDPQSNSYLPPGNVSVKRSRMADAIKVYRPAVLPTRNIPFTKLELPSKETSTLLQRALSSEKVPNGNIELIQPKFPVDNARPLVSAYLNEKLIKNMHEDNRVLSSSFEVSEKFTTKQHGATTECPIVNGLSESSLDSDEDITDTSNNVLEILMPNYCYSTLNSAATMLSN